MPYVNLEVHKGCNLYCGKRAGGIGQDPATIDSRVYAATEVTPFGLNRPPVCVLHGVSWVWLAILNFTLTHY